MNFLKLLVGERLHITSEEAERPILYVTTIVHWKQHRNFWDTNLPKQLRCMSFVKILRMPMKLSSNASFNSLSHFSNKSKSFQKAIGEVAFCRIYFPISVVALLLYRYVTKQVTSLIFLNTDKHFKRFRFRLFHVLAALVILGWTNSKLLSWAIPPQSV